MKACRFEHAWRDAWELTARVGEKASDSSERDLGDLAVLKVLGVAVGVLGRVPCN